jgi:outer membrane receptor for ferrienterochelin and colicins
LKYLLLLFVVTSYGYSQEVQEITVQDLNEKLRSSGRLKDSIIKTEIVDSKEIEKRQAGNLSEAIQNENGIESREGCSICGMRRVRINGMKGEHTTVLMDGIPLNSTVSSYYGFDAMGTSGVDRVEISRGAGASLIAPEAIGGVINIIRKKATKDSSNINLAIGDFDYSYMAGTITKVSKDRKSGTTFTAQYNEQGQMDKDDNGVNESPSINSYLVGLKHYIDLDAKNNITFDVTSLKSDTFGGPMNTSNYEPTVNTGALSFLNNDVRQFYTGSPDQVTEIVSIQRKEATATYTRQLDDYSNIVVKQSIAEQIQDSWYEGSDYFHTNTTLFTDLQYNNQVNTKHFLTIGLDNKNETLQSESYAFYIAAARNSDSYDYNSLGLYIKDVWTPNSKTELSAAVRVNQITTDWTDQAAKENEIDETMFAPRMHLKYGHSEKLTSRLGLGVGYRAPLTFFESEHGILDDGFDVNITELEKSQSATYSLAYDTDRMILNGSVSQTKVENLAYVDDSPAIPVLRNYTNELSVTNFDLTYGYQISKPLSVGLTYEQFDYDDEYKALMVVAAIEQRVKFDIEYETDKYVFNLYVNWIGSRDLNDYGYGGRFNVYNGSGSAPKVTDAPEFYTVDIKGSYSLNENYKLYAGVRNLFDETQEDSPLFFDGSGEFDVTHIYGPLRGRQIYAGLQAAF